MNYVISPPGVDQAVQSTCDSYWAMLHLRGFSRTPHPLLPRFQGWLVLSRSKIEREKVKRSMLFSYPFLSAFQGRRGKRAPPLPRAFTITAQKGMGPKAAVMTLLENLPSTLLPAGLINSQEKQSLPAK